MAKDTYYFKHDYYARNDPKLIRVVIEHGAGAGWAFWGLVEMMYEQGGKLKLSDIPIFARQLRVRAATIEAMIGEGNQFLFHANDGLFYSLSCLERLQSRLIKSEQTSEAAKSRWERMRTHYGTDASLHILDKSIGDKIRVDKSMEDLPPSSPPPRDAAVENNTSLKKKTPTPVFKNYGAEGYENVRLTDDEHGKLVAKFGERDAASWITELSLAKASKGYKSKSDYATILAWAGRRETEKGGGNERYGEAGRTPPRALAGKYTHPEDLP